MNLKLPIQVVISLKRLSNYLALKQRNILSYGLNNTVEIAIKKNEQHLTTNLINENVTNSTSVYFLQQNMATFYLKNKKWNFYNHSTSLSLRPI